MAEPDTLNDLLPPGPAVDLSFLDRISPPLKPDPPEPKGRECETACIPHGLRHVRRSAKRAFLDAQHIDAAVTRPPLAVPECDPPHAIVNAKYKGFDIIPAILRLASPVTIDRLAVTTLSFSRDNAAALLQLLDAGQVKHCRFVCSSYFQRADADIFNVLAEGLASRGHEIRACRNHTKIILAKLTDGRCLTIESSSNLRSCYTLEQLCLTNDASLLEFHESWINLLFQ